MRHAQYLRKRYAAISRYLGEAMMIISILFLAPLLAIPFYPAEARQIPTFLVTAAVAFLVGLACWRLPRLTTDARDITVLEGTVTAVLTWAAVMLLGTLPYILTGALSPLHALFESVSGYSTTGLSVLDVDAAPRTLLLYRSLTQWAGGAGFAIIVLSSIIPGPAGPGLFTAEGRSALFVPNIRESANLVLRIYVVYLVFGVVGLWIAGMSPFDALNHALTATSTGGFSTRPESVGYWPSPVVQGFIIVLMILGSFSFAAVYAISQGRGRLVLRYGEVRLGGTLAVAGSVLLLFGVTRFVYPSFGEATQIAVFETVSSLSSTGFSVTAYGPWRDAGWLVMVMLMMVGGASESTAGGLKQFRIYVLFRSAVWEVQQAFLPKHTVNEPAFWRSERREYISNLMIRQVSLYICIYVALLFLGAGVISLHGHSLRDSLFESASALGTVGLSSGITNPDSSASLLLVLMGGMLLGRLEIMTVLIGGTKLLRDVPEMLGWSPPTRRRAVVPVGEPRPRRGRPPFR